MTEFAGVMMFLLVIGGLVLLVAWIVLPLAMIGTKPILREILAELRETKHVAMEANKRARDAEIRAEQAERAARSIQ